MKTLITAIFALTLGVTTVTSLINVEAAYAILASAGVLLIAISDYSSPTVLN